MSQKVAHIFLAAAVATGGTFTIGYPTGTSRTDFLAGVTHYFLALGGKFSDPTDCTFSFGASNVTITYNGATTLPEGTEVWVNLDQAGRAGDLIDPTTGLTILNTVHAAPVYIDIGNPANASAAAICASQAGTANTALVLTSGASAYVMDYARNVTVTSAGNDTGKTFRVVSYDDYGKKVIEDIAGANAGVAAGVKAHKGVVSVTPSANTAANVTVGFGNVFGLPAYLPSSGYVVQELQDLAKVGSAGTFVAGLSVNTKSTATTADVRGTYTPNATPDGSKSFALLALLPDPTFTGNPQFAG